MQTATCPNEPKVDPRVRRTRKLLEDAFRSLLAEQAYGQISVADIADRATVNRATFYAHFQDKQHLATTMLRDDLEGALFARLTHGDPFTARSLSHVAEALFEFMGKQLKVCPKHAAEFAHTFTPTVQATIEHVLTLWISHDPNAMDAFPMVAKETLATVLSWSLYGGAIRWSTQSHRPSAGQAAQQVVALFFR